MTGREAVVSTAQERHFGAAAHLAPFVGSLIPVFGSFLVTLWVWWRMRESGFVERHARASLNFQLTMSVYYLLALGYVYAYVAFGLLLLGASAVFETVSVMVAARRARAGGVLRVPAVPAIRERRAAAMNRQLGYLLAAVGISALVLAPPELHDYPLDMRLRPLCVGMAGLWVGVRLGLFLKAWKRWGEWRRAPRWSFEAADLPFESTRRWLPRRLARLLYRLLFVDTPWSRGDGVGNWLTAGLGYGLSRRPLYRRALRRVARGLYRDRGIFLGRAFRWTRAHTQELEDFLHQRSTSLPVGQDMRGGYPALHAVGMAREQPLVVPFSELVGHTLIAGTTRSGKTRLLEVILCEAIRGPGTVIVMDPKGDRDLLIRSASQAHAMGRPFAFFSPAFADESASFNPFSACENTTELAERVQVLMPGGGRLANDPFFIEYPLAFVQHIGAAQQALGEDWTIERLNALTTLEPPFERLLARYLSKVMFERPEEPGSADSLIEAYEGMRPEACIVPVFDGLD
jgi:uncharacterized Tic20 family protein